MLSGCLQIHFIHIGRDFRIIAIANTLASFTQFICIFVLCVYEHTRKRLFFYLFRCRPINRDFCASMWLQRSITIHHSQIIYWIYLKAAIHCMWIRIKITNGIACSVANITQDAICLLGICLFFLLFWHKRWNPALK